jgi:hypothetical protein
MTGTSTRSRRKTNVVAPKKTFTLDGKVVDACFCRRCMEQKNPKEFYDATDTQLDRNGKMSICTDCIDDLFNKIFAMEHDLNTTILQLCRMLNVAYNEAAIAGTINHATKMFDKNGQMPPMFGFYKSKMTSISTMNQSGILTFSEPVKMKSDDPMQDNDVENPEYYKLFWGDGLSFDDYSYLETELNDWKKTHKSDTKAEETLLKEICFKMLEIRKKRNIDAGSTGGLVKELQDLMKTASVDPAKASMANAGKSQDTFSAIIKTVEENEPGDYYKDKNLFKDYDNIEWYFDKFVTRPLKNFITESRDFNIDESNSSENDDEIDIPSILGESDA